MANRVDLLDRQARRRLRRDRPPGPIFGRAPRPAEWLALMIAASVLAGAAPSLDLAVNEAIWR